MEYRLVEDTRTRGPVGQRIGWLVGRRKRQTRGSAKVGPKFQVSGLGRREPGSGVQVRVQVQDLNFILHPHLYLITRTRDLKAET